MRKGVEGKTQAKQQHLGHPNVLPSETFLYRYAIRGIQLLATGAVGTSLLGGGREGRLKQIRTQKEAAVKACRGNRYQTSTTPLLFS